MWNRGKTTVRIPVEKLKEPDPEWGARRRDQSHVNVCTDCQLIIFRILIHCRT